MNTKRGYVEMRGGVPVRGIIGLPQRMGATTLDADELRISTWDDPVTYVTRDGVYRAMLRSGRTGIRTVHLGTRLKGGRDRESIIRTEAKRLTDLGSERAGTFRTDKPGVTGFIQQESLINEASEAKKAQTLALGLELAKWAQEQR